MISVNEYENGSVKSLGFESGGLSFTVGVVRPGTYSFPTEKEERITVTVGAIEFRLPGKGWERVPAGETMVVPAGTRFDLRVDRTASYVCKYR